MNNELSELEKSVLELRQTKGFTIEETINKLHLKRKEFQNIVSKLKKLNLYNEEEIKKAQKNKKIRENRNKNKFKPKLTEEEEMYRKKSIDFMCRKYFDYNLTHHFNPILVAKLQELGKITSYKVIYNTIIYQEKSLNFANTKTFSSDYQKISYMMAIIKNNLSIVWKKLQRQDQIRESKEKGEDKEIVKQLNKKYETKPTERFDMSAWLD